MKPFSQLTRLGRLRRMRRIADTALQGFGIHQARLHLLRQAGNTLFRVYAPSTAAESSSSDLFEPGQYLLRIHQPRYQQTDAIELELAWLTAMRRQADLPVQEPLASCDGRLLLPVSVAGVPGARDCSLLRWVKGRSLVNRVRPHHLHLQGQLMAQMHSFAQHWQAPACPDKRRFDWDGLFQNDVGSGMPNREAWALLKPSYRNAFSFVAERVSEVMNAWGQSSEVYGLIHGDLGVDANLLFWHGSPRAIDFDDSGFGYWIFDLAVALEHCWADPAFPRFRDALLAGYAAYRQLPLEEVDQIELFIAALEVYWNLWATGGTHLYPHLLPEYQERMTRTAELVVRYVEKQNESLT